MKLIQLLLEDNIPTSIPSDIMYHLSSNKGMSGDYFYHIGTLLQALHRGSTMQDIQPEEKFYLHTVKFNPNVTIYPKVVDDDPEEGYDEDFDLNDLGETDVVIYNNAVEGLTYPEPLPDGCKTADKEPNYSIYAHRKHFKVVKVEELTTGWKGDDYNEELNQHTRALYAACKLDYVPDVDENYADSKVKGKSRPGRVKKSGASCKGSVTDLRAKAKKYGGEKGKMYHWCANMKGGK